MLALLVTTTAQKRTQFVIWYSKYFFCRVCNETHNVLYYCLNNADILHRNIFHLTFVILFSHNHVIIMTFYWIQYSQCLLHSSTKLWTHFGSVNNAVFDQIFWCYRTKSILSRFPLLTKSNKIRKIHFNSFLWCKLK